MAKQTQTEKLNLQAEIRTEVGKKVKRLRKQGLIPANIYGPDFKSVAVIVKNADFLQTYRKAHETGIVYIQIEGKSYPTLIKHLQKHPINSSVLHVDFRKIDLNQKIETTVPVEVVGESPAAKTLGGMVMILSPELAIEALPENIPSHISVDISTMAELGQEIKVADLPKNDKYVIKEDAEKAVVAVIEHKEESITPETAAPITEVIEEPKEGEEAAPEEAPAEAAKQ